MKTCKHCDEEITRGKYCSNRCQALYQSLVKIKEWLAGKNFVRKGGDTVPSWMRKYLLEEARYKCNDCSWNKINEFTQTSPIEVDHIDGDAHNNLRENLRILCPSCHSLTKTYKNIGSRKSSRTR